MTVNLSRYTVLKVKFFWLGQTLVGPKLPHRTAMFFNFVDRVFNTANKRDRETVAVASHTVSFNTAFYV